MCVDDQQNHTAAGDRDLTAAGAAVASFVLTTREELELASQVRPVLS
ncbi:MAG: hypothetical protein ACYC91_19480 [Solirubrobacteraceae bacterium]